jgi:hypothetical protein
MELLLSGSIGIASGGLLFMFLPRILPESMRRQRLLHFAIGLIVFLAFIRLGYSYYDQNSKKREIEKTFEKVRNEPSVKAFLDAIEKVDPQGYAQYRKNTIDTLLSSDQDQPTEKFYARVQKEVFAFWSGYFDKATPEAIAENIDAQIKLLTELKTQNPDLACRVAFPLIFGPPLSSELSLYPTHVQYVKSLEVLISSSMRPKPVHIEGATNFAVFSANFRTKYPKAIKSLSQISQVKSDAQKREVAESLIVFLIEIQKIDKISAANIFRSFFKTGAN